MQRDSDGMPNELQRALLEYSPTDLEESLIEWTREHWPMAARAMVYNKSEGDQMVSGVQGVRSDEGQLVMQVAARVAISERELLIRGIAAVLPEWLEQRYGLTPK
jgi:outer membrane lipopolysaccharide assembly protein LptE/RlpB